MDIKKELVEVVKGVQRDTVLRNQGEVGVRRVVKEGGGDEAARGGDEGRGGPLGSFRNDDFIGENAGGRGDFDRRVGVDVDVVEIRGSMVEEEVPEGEEVKVGVGEEEEGDFGAEGGGGAEAGFGGGAVVVVVVGIRGRLGGEGYGFMEEGKIVELVGGGDGEAARREERRG